MDNKARAASVILAIFPTFDSFRRFSYDLENHKSLESLIFFAYRNGLVASEAPDAFENYIRKHSGSKEVNIPPNHLRFGDLFDQKDVLLELNLSARALTDRINRLITEHRVELPKLSNSMFSRLKKEAADTLHKQNVLRSLAFWLGHDRPHLVDQWNYETLLALCREGKQTTEHKGGVRIGFALYSRGDVIDHDVVGWLKRELKSYIDSSLHQFSYGRWGKVRSHDITTLYVDFPKEQETDKPAAYRQCLRSGVSLAHQIAIRWALSAHHSRNRFLSIGIATGDFAGLDNHLIPIFNAKLPGDPVIRLTDYTRQCIMINDIRAILCSHPLEITLLNGETLPAWWVNGFWSTLYFDFVPDLIEDPILGVDENAFRHLVDSLWPTIVDDYTPTEGKGSDAISTFFRNPHNALLGLEIAKTLYYRRRFREALEILKIVLSLDPTHLNARTLRMVLLRNLALESPSYRIAEGLFQQAHQEAENIEQTCDYRYEDFFCEYAVLYLAQAMMTVRYLRAGGGHVTTADNGRISTRKVMAWLNRAEALFNAGIMVSPTGIRAIYLLTTVRILKVIFLNDKQLVNDETRPIDGPAELIIEACNDFHWQTGYLREDLSNGRPNEIIEKIFKLVMSTHDDSISLQAYRPTTYYCMGVAWWDIFPERTVGTAKNTLKILQDSATIAKKIGQKQVCIYSFTRTYGEMMPVDQFVSHIENCIRMVQAQSGGNLANRKDEELIETGSKENMGLLMTLNF